MYRDELDDAPLPGPGSLVAVAMSGGVDSSVAAALMAERGCRVVGATMATYDGSVPFPPGTGSGCYGPGEEEDVEACRRLCADIGAEYHLVDLSAAYKIQVLDYFRREYRAGRTPNPCVRCNPALKFGLLPEALRERGVDFDFFVTGHYGRVLAPGGDTGRGVYLAPAALPGKDQSYFLYALGSRKLRKVRFPLGGYAKAEVREMARRWGLGSAEKKDSQDFIAKEDYGILFGSSGAVEGPIVHVDGRVLGHHRGIEKFTIGQRRGVAVSAGGEPLYVVAIDAETRTVTVGPDAELFSTGLEASGALWYPPFGTEPLDCLVKIRLATPPARAVAYPLDGGGLRIAFREPQRAVAPGQAAVIYVEAKDAGGSAVQVIAGGGTIVSAFREG